MNLGNFSTTSLLFVVGKQIINQPELGWVALTEDNFFLKQIVLRFCPHEIKALINQISKYSAEVYSNTHCKSKEARFKQSPDFYFTVIGSGFKFFHCRFNAWS